MWTGPWRRHARAFDSYSRSTREERLALMERMLAAYKKHYDEIAQAISLEMGAPVTPGERLADWHRRRPHQRHDRRAEEISSSRKCAATVRLVQEPVGVCALITPWNWPMNQVAAKVVPALAAGCTMVLKPSEFSPFSAILWAQGHARGRCAEGRVQPDQWRWPQRRGAAVVAPGRRHGVVHRLDPRRDRGGQERRRLRQARAPGTGRQVAERAARRRRFRQGREGQRPARVSELRPVL